MAVLRATRARFELFPDQLLFAHNGSRRFKVSNPETEEDQEQGKLGDINSITAVGTSNKLEEDLIGNLEWALKRSFSTPKRPIFMIPEYSSKLNALSYHAA